MDIISLMYFCLYKVYFFIVQLCAIVTRSINATYLLIYFIFGMLEASALCHYSNNNNNLLI